MLVCSKLDRMTFEIIYTRALFSLLQAGVIDLFLWGGGGRVEGREGGKMVWCIKASLIKKYHVINLSVVGKNTFLMLKDQKF
jgi:hypothetical protein